MIAVEFNQNINSEIIESDEHEENRNARLQKSEFEVKREVGEKL